HDYVVRAWYGPYRLDAGGAWQHSFALKPEWKGHDVGAAIFAQERNNGEVLQALSLPFCS
ncbi:MAG TPA: DUF1223 domain-containing protein, partial [Methylophilaceae bacterium]|nr:DUF1223 domain-containing protein [Methylophilaceae bacterium]